MRHARTLRDCMLRGQSVPLGMSGGHARGALSSALLPGDELGRGVHSASALLRYPLCRRLMGGGEPLLLRLGVPARLVPRLVQGNGGGTRAAGLGRRVRARRGAIGTPRGGGGGGGRPLHVEAIAWQRLELGKEGRELLEEARLGGSVELRDALQIVGLVLAVCERLPRPRTLLLRSERPRLRRWIGGQQGRADCHAEHLAGTTSTRMRSSRSSRTAAAATAAAATAATTTTMRLRLVAPSPAHLGPGRQVGLESALRAAEEVSQPIQVLRLPSHLKECDAELSLRSIGVEVSLQEKGLEVAGGADVLLERLWDGQLGEPRPHRSRMAPRHALLIEGFDVTHRVADEIHHFPHARKPVRKVGDQAGEGQMSVRGVAVHESKRWFHLAKFPVEACRAHTAGRCDEEETLVMRTHLEPPQARKGLSADTLSDTPPSDQIG